MIPDPKASKVTNSLAWHMSFNVSNVPNLNILLLPTWFFYHIFQQGQAVTDIEITSGHNFDRANIMQIPKEPINRKKRYNMTLAPDLFRGESITENLYRIFIKSVVKFTREHWWEMWMRKNQRDDTNIVNLTLESTLFLREAIVARTYKFLYIVYLLYNTLQQIDEECK